MTWEHADAIRRCAAYVGASARGASARGASARGASARGASASRDRALRIADPLAPGARVQLRARKSRQLQGEQVVAGGDAGAAHGDYISRLRASQPLAP